MASQFIEQIQILMHEQQIKCTELDAGGKSNYKWLCNKKAPLIWMSVQDEYLIRQALNKITDEQKMQIIKQLLIWLSNNPEISSSRIPEMCIIFLNQAATINFMNEVTISRMSSFRRSLRRLSLIGTSRIAPLMLPQSHVKPRKSVSFKEDPIVYQISSR